MKLNKGKTLARRFIYSFAAVLAVAVVAGGVVVVNKTVSALTCGWMCQQRLNEGFPSDSSAVDAAMRGDTYGGGRGAECALWIAENGNPASFFHEVTEEESAAGNFYMRMYGWCSTPGPWPGQVATHIQIGNDGGSMSGDIWSDMFRPVPFGEVSAHSKLLTVNIDRFKDGAQVEQRDDGNVYTRTIEICRCNKTAGNLSGNCFNDKYAGKNCGIDRFRASVKVPEESITFRYVGEDKCNPATPGEREITSSQTIRDNKEGDLLSEKNVIRAVTKIKQLEGQGWTLESSDMQGTALYPPEEGIIPDYYVTANMNNHSITITFRFSKRCTIIIPECSEWEPPSFAESDAYHGETSVISVVKNASLDGVNKNGEWHGSGKAEKNPALVEPNEITYAKPEDVVHWRHCYFPGVQTTFNTLGSINKRHDYHGDPNAPLVDSSIDNQPMQNHSWWPQNAFNISSFLLNPAYSKSVTLPTGQAKAEVDDNDYNVARQNLHAGDTLREKIVTNGVTGVNNIVNEGIHSWPCHEDTHTYTDANGNVQSYTHMHDTCKHDKDFWNWNIYKNGAEDSSIAKVPYNFLNSVVATIASPDPVYEAETLQLQDAVVHVGTRQNDETAGNYATEVESIGQAKIIAFLEGPGWTSDQLVGVTKQDNYGNSISEGYIWNNDSGESICAVTNAKYGQCRDYESKQGTFNSEGKLEGDDVINVSGGTYNIFDEAAGNQICVAAAIYPYTVKNTGDEKDKDMDKHGDHAWLMSEPDCRTIAKKPNFQVWGSGVYSNGGIDTLISTKNNLKYISGWDWRAKPESPYAIFSSWGELSVTMGGKTSTMASGAATGHTGGTDGPSDPSTARQVSDTGRPGGLKNGADFCMRSPISIANVEANGSGSGLVTCQGNAGYAGGFSNKETLASSVTADNVALTEMLADYPGVEKEDLATIGRTVIGKGVTRVNIHNGDIWINDSITYGEGNNANLQYSSPQEIPKYIIYAKGGNINIACNVKRIDAVLITDDDKSIDTCYNGGDVNSGARSNQLVITGAAITGTLNLNRTYGTGIGRYSIAPAELINYDSSLYLWANAQSEGATSGQMSETAIRELAPRY